MPTGQNPVQPMTDATKYYKSLSLLFLLPFFAARETCTKSRLSENSAISSAKSVSVSMIAAYLLLLEGSIVGLSHFIVKCVYK